MLLIKPDDERTQSLKSVSDARDYFDELLPQFSPYISDDALASVLEKPPSRLPVFRYSGPRLHRKGSTVLLGDAIHTVKPYFGLGANSALEDVVALRTALDEQPNSLADALATFSACSRRPQIARAATNASAVFILYAWGTRIWQRKLRRISTRNDWPSLRRIQHGPMTVDDLNGQLLCPEEGPKNAIQPSKRLLFDPRRPHFASKIPMFETVKKSPQTPQKCF